jgi:hypothetical protein
MANQNLAQPLSVIGLGFLAIFALLFGPSPQPQASPLAQYPSATPYPASASPTLTLTPSLTLSPGLAGAATATATFTPSPTIAAPPTTVAQSLSPGPATAITVAQSPTPKPTNTRTITPSPSPTATTTSNVTQADTVLICVPGQTLRIRGKTNYRNAKLLLFFGKRIAGAGTSDTQGAYDLPLVVGNEAPKHHAIEVKTWSTRETLLSVTCYLYPTPTRVND